MGKSEGKNIIVDTVATKHGLLEESFKWFDTYKENARRNNITSLEKSWNGVPKIPVTISLIDGSVLVVHYFQSNSKPDLKGVSVGDYFKQGEKQKEAILKRNSKEEVCLLDEYNAEEELGIDVIREGKHSFESKRRFKKEAFVTPVGTWGGLVSSFVASICREVVKLSPPSFQHIGEDGEFISCKDTIHRPILAPIVMLGFDRYSEEIKENTRLERNAQCERSMKKRKVEDVKHGCQTTRGLPLLPSFYDTPGFNPLRVSLPYPPEEVLRSRESKNIIINFICKELIAKAISGDISKKILMDNPKINLPRVLQISLDGHHLLKSDLEGLIEEESLAHMVSDEEMLVEDALRIFNVNKKSELPFGAASPHYFRPISIFIVSDYADMIRNTPICNCRDVVGNCRCLQSIVESRRVELKTPKGENAVIYAFVGESLPDQIYSILEKHYVDTPHIDCVFEKNTIGECDFSTFHHLHTVIQRMKSRYVNYVQNERVFKEGEIRLVNGRIDFPFAARIVTVDTDCFVLSSMAIEILKEFGVALDIFIVNNHSQVARKELGLFEKSARSLGFYEIRMSDIGISPGDAVKISSGKMSPVYPVLSVRPIVKTYARLFPTSLYPLSSLLLILYMKQNDYMSIGWKGIALTSFYSNYIAYFNHIGHNLIFHKPGFDERWAVNLHDQMVDPEILIDKDVITKFHNILIVAESGRYMNYKPVVPAELENQASVLALKEAGFRKKRKRNVTDADYTKEQLAEKILQISYIFHMYFDAVLGRMGTDGTRTIHPKLRDFFGFTISS